MPMKPTKRGYKVWVCAHARTGYIYQFEVYTGKSDNKTTVGLGGSAVQSLCASLRNTSTHVAFDNFFSSYTLVETLFDMGIYSTCTVRSNRRDLPKLASRKTVMEKGEHKWRTRSHTGYVQWMDTKLVSVLSTAFSPTSVGNVDRQQKDGTKHQFTCPMPIVEYTRRMGGVDRSDQQRTMYSVSRRSKRSWLRIFFFLLDTALVNAYALYASVHPDNALSRLDFRVQLARALLGNYTSRKRSLVGTSYLVRRRSHDSQNTKRLGVPDNVRTESVGVHWPQMSQVFKRCRLCSSAKNNKRSRIACSTCNVHLCIFPCFTNFHLQK